MAPVMLQVIPSFYAKVSKNSLFVSANTYEKYISSKEYCIANAMIRYASYPVADIKFFCWVTLKSCCRNWIHCISYINKWTVSMHSSSIDSVEILLSSGQVLGNVQRSVCFYEKKQEWTECLGLQKRDYWGKSTESILWSPLKRQSQRKPVDEFIEKKVELEHFRILYCCLGGYGINSCNLVTFEIRCL